MKGKTLESWQKTLEQVKVRDEIFGKAKEQNRVRMSEAEAIHYLSK